MAWTIEGVAGGRVGRGRRGFESCFEGLRCAHVGLAVLNLPEFKAFIDLLEQK